MHCSSSMRVDVAIVGGGPAGLSAALMLGRCRRTVVVFDDGNYRNRDARVVHGFLTRDHAEIPPEELRALGRADLCRYPTVSMVYATVVDARQEDGQFVLVAESGDELACQALLLATGFRDRRPDIAGVTDLHGAFVAPCPYCDAWDVRDQPLAALSHCDERGAAFARVLGRWSGDIVLFGERPSQLSDVERAALAARGVLVEQRIVKLVTRDGDGIRLVLSDGTSIWRRMLFYHLGGEPMSTLASRLGAQRTEHGSFVVDRHEKASIPGLFIAGDATRDALQAIVAAGEGSTAAIAINEYLCEKE